MRNISVTGSQQLGPSSEGITSRPFFLLIFRLQYKGAVYLWAASFYHWGHTNRQGFRRLSRPHFPALNKYGTSHRGENTHTLLFFAFPIVETRPYLMFIQIKLLNASILWLWTSKNLIYQKICIPSFTGATNQRQDLQTYLPSTLCISRSWCLIQLYLTLPYLTLPYNTWCLTPHDNSLTVQAPFQSFPRGHPLTLHLAK